MKLTIEITCDNAAFFMDDGDGAQVGPELARMLRKYATEIEDYYDPRREHKRSWSLSDVNGNVVGRAVFTDEPPSRLRRTNQGMRP